MNDAPMMTEKTISSVEGGESVIIIWLNKPYSKPPRKASPPA